MKPLEFSEFSYGFALTDSLRQTLPGGFQAAPVLPSLIEEGRPGGGYDVKIAIIGVPLLLQFKVPQVLQRTSRLKPSGFNLPYYRMHLRPYKHSSQHKMLMSLERQGNFVFYVCPRFHLVADLNTYFANLQVSHQSAYFSALGIGPLPDNEGHYVAYEPRGNVYHLCSEEPSPPIKFGLDLWEQKIQAALDKVNTQDATNESFQRLHDSMVRAIDEGRKQNSGRNSKILDMPDQPIRAAAYLARLHFDSELYVLTRANERSQ